MSKESKEIARYILLVVLTIGAYSIVNAALMLEQDGKLTMQFAGITGTYLAVWGYIVKWFFNSRVAVENSDNNNTGFNNDFR